MQREDPGDELCREQENNFCFQPQCFDIWFKTKPGQKGPKVPSGGCTEHGAALSTCLHTYPSNRSEQLRGACEGISEKIQIYDGTDKNFPAQARIGDGQCQVFRPEAGKPTDADEAQRAPRLPAPPDSLMEQNWGHRPPKCSYPSVQFSDTFPDKGNFQGIWRTDRQGSRRWAEHPCKAGTHKTEQSARSSFQQPWIAPRWDVCCTPSPSSGVRRLYAGRGKGPEEMPEGFGGLGTRKPSGMWVERSVLNSRAVTHTLSIHQSPGRRKKPWFSLHTWGTKAQRAPKEPTLEHRPQPAPGTLSQLHTWGTNRASDLLQINKNLAQEKATETNLRSPEPQDSAVTASICQERLPVL